MKIILILFKPLRLNTLTCDIVAQYYDFASTLDTFHQNLINNIDYLQKSQDDALKEQEDNTNNSDDSEEYNNQEEETDINYSEYQEIIQCSNNIISGNEQDNFLKEAIEISNIKSNIKKYEPNNNETISVNNNDITSWQNVYKTLSNKLLQPSITKDTNENLTMTIQNFQPIQIQSNDFNQISKDTIINKYNLNNDQIIMFNIYTENIFKSIKQKICYLGGNAGTGMNKKQFLINYFYTI